MSAYEAMEIMRGECDKHFDKRILEAFFSFYTKTYLQPDSTEKTNANP